MNKKYTYESVTGSIEIEIDESWEAILVAMDEAEKNEDRRHHRSDHKYAPGEPISLDNLLYEGDWLADTDDDIASIELAADLEQALLELTELQRRYFLMAYVDGFTCAEIARLEGKNKTTVWKTVEAARERLKNLLS